MADPRDSLEYENGRAYCPFEECEWSVVEQMDEAFFDHYYEHTELVDKYPRFQRKTGEEEDIDFMHDNVDFRCEKMTESAIWMVAYGYENDDGDEIDIHYDFYAKDEGYIEVVRRVERSVD